MVYEETIRRARDLLAEQIRDPQGEANPEYTRGICELIADCFPLPDTYMDDRKAQVARDIGVEVS